MTFELNPWLDPPAAPATSPEAPASAAAESEAAAEPEAPEAPATPLAPAAPGPRPAPARHRDAGGLRLVVASAALAALVGAGMTGGLLLATVPAPLTATASPTGSVAPVSTVATRTVGADPIAAVAAATEPSVVTIGGTGARFGSAGGSGIVVSADGLILTTAVVAPVDGTYDVTFADQRTTTASVVASDPTKGLVLLRAGRTGLTPARLGNGAALLVGQRVVAIGSPLGEFTDTVTSGIVSGLDRAIDLRDPSSGIRVALSGLIQTDAAINAGSSGGPLLDTAGTVVGVIATSASDGQRIGFAIPITAALDLIARARA